MSLSVSFPTKAELERQAEQEEKFEKFEAKVNKEPRVALLRKKLTQNQERIIVAERTNKELDKCTGLVQRQIKALQAVYGGPSAVEENMAAVGTQRSILTRRVAAAVRDKEKIGGEKRRLRDAINELRRDHAHLQEVERRSLATLREYLGVDLSIHATVWAMQMRLNRKRFDAGQPQRSASLSQNTRRALYAVATGVSKMLTPATRDMFHNFIVERVRPRADGASTSKSGADSPTRSGNGTVGTGAPAKASSSSAAAKSSGSGGGGGGGSGAAPEARERKGKKGILPLPADLVAAISGRELAASDERRSSGGGKARGSKGAARRKRGGKGSSGGSSNNKAGDRPGEREFGIIVEKINHYVQIKKDMAAVQKAGARSDRETKQELGQLQRQYDRVMANEEATRMLAEAAQEHDDIAGVAEAELAQSLGSMSIEEEKRKRRTVQLQVLMRETHKVASKNRAQRLSAYKYVFDVIFDITGTSNVDDFLAHYKENDQANLRLLQLVSQLENEHQELSDDLEKLKSDSLLNSMDADAARSAKVHSNIVALKNRRGITLQALEAARHDLHDAKRLVAALVAGVRKILGACKDHIKNTKYIGDVLAEHLQAEHEQLGLNAHALLHDTNEGGASSGSPKGGKGGRGKSAGIVRTVKKLTQRPNQPHHHHGSGGGYEVPSELRTVLADKALPTMGDIVPGRLPEVDDDSGSPRPHRHSHHQRHHAPGAARVGVPRGARGDGSGSGRGGRHAARATVGGADGGSDDGSEYSQESDDTAAPRVAPIDDAGAMKNALHAYEARKSREMASITRKTTVAHHFPTSP